MRTSSPSHNSHEIHAEKTTPMVYGILIIGKTVMDKSTTGNKLLEIHSTDESSMAHVHFPTGRGTKEFQFHQIKLFVNFFRPYGLYSIASTDVHRTRI